MIKRALLLYFMTLTALLSCSICFAQESPVTADTADLYASWRSSVVQVRVIEKQSRSKSGIGSGFVSNQSGLIVTNYHVIADLANQPDDYDARFLSEDGTEGSLQLVSVDVVHDLAVLSTPKPMSPGLPTADQAPRKGTRLYSMGFPYDIGLRIVEGTYNGLLEKTLYKRLHFTGSINPGMSGGPVLNQAGQVVGINVATAGNEVGFLVPVEYARSLLDEAADSDKSVSLDQSIASQLQINQAAIARQLLSGDLIETRLNAFIVPGELAEWMNCWGNSLQGDSDQMKHVYYQCQSQDDIFLSDSLYTGVIRFQHDLISSESLHPLRFYHQLEKRSYFPSLRLEGNEETVTGYECQSGFIDQDGLSFKSTFCVRGYRKMAGIYDAYLYLTSLVDGHEALQSTLVLSGFDWENLTAISQQFMGGISLEPDSP